MPSGEPRPDAPAKPPPAGFLDRLPAHLGNDVVYLKVSGHYLEVVTTGGSAVILQRLMDAVRELASYGMQTHRSYWVAHRHIRYVVRRERRTLLHLTGDYEVPVSRTYLPEVRRRIKPQRRSGTAPPAIPSSRRVARPFATQIQGQVERARGHSVDPIAPRIEAALEHVHFQVHGAGAGVDLAYRNRFRRRGPSGRWRFLPS